MFLDARKFEAYVDAEELIYDGRGIVLHLADQQAFSGIPRFTLGSSGEPVMVGGSIGSMPMKREPLRFADPCVAVFQESIKEALPKGTRAMIICDTRVTTFGIILPQFIIPEGYFGPLQSVVYPGRRQEIATGYPMARLYFIDDSIEGEE